MCRLPSQPPFAAHSSSDRREITRSGPLLRLGSATAQILLVRSVHWYPHLQLSSRSINADGDFGANVMTFPDKD
jgi:hypothetical protein